MHQLDRQHLIFCSAVTVIFILLSEPNLIYCISCADVQYTNRVLSLQISFIALVYIILSIYKLSRSVITLLR